MINRDVSKEKVPKKRRPSGPELVEGLCIPFSAWLEITIYFAAMCINNAFNITVCNTL